MGLPVSRWAGLAALLALGLPLSACSTPPAGSVSAAELVPEIQSAANTATSVHVSGSMKHGAQTATIDVSIDGNSVAGFLGAYRTRFYVLSLNGDSFVKLNAAFLNLEGAPAALCARICGKYVELPAASALQITGFLSMQQLVNEVFDTGNMGAAAHSGCTFSPASVNGQAVLQCRQGDATLDVAAHGRPYLVYWSGPHGQHLAFSEWNSVVLPAAPPTSEVVSTSNLG